MQFNALLPEYRTSTPDVNRLLQPLSDAYGRYQDRTRKAAIGSRLADGDYAGAAAEAGRQGDIDTSLGIARFQTQQKQADIAAKSAEIDHAAKAAHLYGGVAQVIAGEQDPAKASAMWQRVVAAHPEMGSKLTAWGVDPADPKAGAAFLIAQARGYQDPTKEAMGKAELAKAQNEVGNLPVRNEALGIAVEKDRMERDKLRRELEHPAIDIKTLKEGETPYFVDRRSQKVQFLDVPGQNGAPKEFKQAAAKQVAEIYGEHVKDGQKAAQSSMDLAQLSQLSDVLGSGKFTSWLPVVGPWAQSLGVTIDGLNEAQAFQAIVSRVAPSMRPTGSGATSDKDMAIFLNSLPQLSQTQEGRRMVLQHLSDMTQFSQHRAAVASAVLTGKMSPQDGEAAIARLASPTFESKVSAPPPQKSGGIPEGTVIANAKGERLVMRGGKWVPHSAEDASTVRSGVE